MGQSLLEVVQSSASRKTTAQDIADLADPGITNTAANNELMKSDGTNAVPSGLFASTNGSLDLGSASISGNRVMQALSSSTNSSITITPKGTGIVTVSGA